MEPLNEDLSGKICIITGANSGIGKQATTELARMGAKIIMACRNQQRGEAAIADITSVVPDASLDLQIVDLSRQSSIRDFASRFLAGNDRLDILINNAGIYPRVREMTTDGVETTWATNVIGYILLTTLLADVLEASAPSRVLNVASTMTGEFDIDDLFFDRRRFGGIAAYKQSKQADRMLTWVQAEHFEGTGITVNAIHPGMVATGIGRGQRGPWGALVRAAFKLRGKPVEEGADTLVWAAASPELDGKSSQFLSRRRSRHCEFRDTTACHALWDACQAMIVSA